MPQTTKRGPLPVEDAAVNYAIDLYGRLRCGYGWRKDVFSVLRREYAHFVRMAIAGNFDVLAMWEYAQLVAATDQYLRYKESAAFSNWFYIKVCRELAGIDKQIQRFEFDQQENSGMLQALERMAPLIRRWGTTEEARE